ncbi:MAG: hypothetical protein ACYCXJ_00595, partial [Thermoleophilia bacterium]
VLSHSHTAKKKNGRSKLLLPLLNWIPHCYRHDDENPFRSQPHAAGILQIHHGQTNYPSHSP